MCCLWFGLVQNACICCGLNLSLFQNFSNHFDLNFSLFRIQPNDRNYIFASFFPRKLRVIRKWKDLVRYHVYKMCVNNSVICEYIYRNLNMNRVTKTIEVSLDYKYEFNNDLLYSLITQGHPTTESFQRRQKCRKWISLCSRRLFS